MNSKIAELLAKQTYDERIGMGQFFADSLIDAGDTDCDFFARTIGCWAENEIEQ